MTRRDKIALMTYKALALYLHVYPKERTRLKRLLGKRTLERVRKAEGTPARARVNQKKLFL